MSKLRFSAGLLVAGGLGVASCDAPAEEAVTDADTTAVELPAATADGDGAAEATACAAGCCAAGACAAACEGAWCAVDGDYGGAPDGLGDTYDAGPSEGCSGIDE